MTRIALFALFLYLFVSMELLSSCSSNEQVSDAGTNDELKSEKIPRQEQDQGLPDLTSNINPQQIPCEKILSTWKQLLSYESFIRCNKDTDCTVLIDTESSCGCISGLSDKGGATFTSKYSTLAIKFLERLRSQECKYLLKICRGEVGRIPSDAICYQGKCSISKHLPCE